MFNSITSGERYMCIYLDIGVGAVVCRPVPDTGTLGGTLWGRDRGQSRGRGYRTCRVGKGSQCEEVSQLYSDGFLLDSEEQNIQSHITNITNSCMTESKCKMR